MSRLINRIACTVYWLSQFCVVINSEKSRRSLTTGIGNNIQRRPGAFIEAWENIDLYKVKYLLQDPRFPSMPSYTAYVTTFSSKPNWGDNFGTRIRAYFVPKQTGLHQFYIAADDSGNLYLSYDSNPDNKVRIAYEEGSQTTTFQEWSKYQNQHSEELMLTKGKYYYIEALHKEQYGSDDLDVAVKTPDGKFYGPIPSDFLWTDTPPPPSLNSTINWWLMNIAARAGAKAGASIGMAAASRTGTRTGAIAGAQAGGRAGAEAGAKAGEKAAAEMTLKTINEGLKNIPINGQIFNIYLANETVVTEPVRTVPGSTDPGKMTAGQGAVAQGRGGGVDPGTGVGTGTGTEGVVTGGATAGEATGGMAGATVGAGASSSSIGGGAAIGGTSTGSNAASSLGASPTLGMQTGFAATLVPKDGEDPNAIARVEVYKTGGAKTVISGAFYKIYAWDVPERQFEIALNFCWTSRYGRLMLLKKCQYFKAYVPSLYNKTIPSASFESTCFPGYYLKQKNYRYILDKRDGSSAFDRDASFLLIKPVKYPRNILLDSMHFLWGPCRTDPVYRHDMYIDLTYDRSSSDRMKRCSYVFVPIEEGADPKENCKQVLAPYSPKTIPRQSSKFVAASAHKTTTAGKAQKPATHEQYAGEMCVALNFINQAGSPYKLTSSLKHEDYLVKGAHFKLRILVHHPQLHQHVTFRAWDPSGQNTILLDDQSEISVIPTPGCSKFHDVFVSSKPGPAGPSIPELPAKSPFLSSTRKGPSSHHYHFPDHPAPEMGLASGCPATCRAQASCQTLCPARCCESSSAELELS